MSANNQTDRPARMVLSLDSWAALLGLLLALLVKLDVLRKVPW